MQHRVVSREQWLEERRAHLAEEKRLTRERDALLARRRELPWVKVDKDYRFKGSDGELSLADLFGPNSQLIVYHFMFGPGWAEGCDGCSFLADHFDGARLHIEHHDVSLVAVSRAPYSEFAPFRQRMGWRFPWVSSAGSDFNVDFDASHTEEGIADGHNQYNFTPRGSTSTGEAHGFSVFVKDADGAINHTYSCYARGGEEVIGAHMLLDLTPLGRNEGSTMDWVRLHDQYDGAESAGCCGSAKPAEAGA